MNHSHHNPPSAGPSAESIQHGHEITDAEPKSILIFLISLSITIAVIVAVTVGLFFIFRQGEDEAVNAEYVSSPLAEARPLSPAPPLQPSLNHEFLPYQDTGRMKVENDRLAGSYGNEMMADHAMHDRIPVQAAILILADQGLPHDTATNIPSPQGPAPSVPTPYGDGGRGSPTGTAAAPGMLQK